MSKIQTEVHTQIYPPPTHFPKQKTHSMLAFLYAPSHRQDRTYHGLCYTSRVAPRFWDANPLSNNFNADYCRCHYTKSNPIDDHSNISSQTLQKQNFKPLGHYTCMQSGTSHLQTVQENILSHIILATYRKFTVATVRFTQNVSCNIYTHKCHCVIIHQTTKATEYIG